jgi:uncharacterized protein GlcG (DUF336 family)
MTAHAIYVPHSRSYRRPSSGIGQSIIAGSPSQHIIWLRAGRRSGRVLPRLPPCEQPPNGLSDLRQNGIPLQIAWAVAAALSVGAGAQGLVTQKNIPLAMAQTIANAALAKCESMGFKVSVVVVDRDGLPIVMLRGDGSGLHTPEGADRKAYTARTFSQPSAAFTKRMIDDPNSVGSDNTPACWRCPAGCRLRRATMWSARSASPVHPARTTSARRPESTRSPIN